MNKKYETDKYKRFQINRKELDLEKEKYADLIEFNNKLDYIIEIYDLSSKIVLYEPTYFASLKINNISKELTPEERKKEIARINRFPIQIDAKIPEFDVKKFLPLDTSKNRELSDSLNKLKREYAHKETKSLEKINKVKSKAILINKYNKKNNINKKSWYTGINEKKENNEIMELLSKNKTNLNDILNTTRGIGQDFDKKLKDICKNEISFQNYFNNLYPLRERGNLSTKEKDNLNKERKEISKLFCILEIDQGIKDCTKLINE